MSSRRFENRPPVWQVNDRADTPELEPREYIQLLNFVDSIFMRRLTRTMEIALPTKAKDTNSLDEVPNSTWFTNRIGVRDMSPTEVFLGPGYGDVPAEDRRWTILGAKVGGGSVGFLVADEEGEKHLLKFDPAGFGELESGADVVTQRILWAAGYHVPEDNVVFVAKENLRLADGAVVEDIFGRTRPMTAADVTARLEQVHQEADGRFRALASKFLHGVPLGGFPQEGLRDDDPNDLVPHEHRRSVRAMRVFFSWLSNTDVKEANTLDMWVQDPSDAEKHYVVHYLVDFGKALGAHAVLGRYLDSGYAHGDLDIAYAVLSLPTLGLWKRPWEGRDDPGIPGVGFFDSEHFEFDTWRGHFPYIPFSYLDANDAFWATKIMMRFTPAHIRAAVKAARYAHPRAVDYLVQTLIARQRIIGAHWLRRVNPLDQFRVEEKEDAVSLCFDDLLRRYRLGTLSGTTYWAQAFSHTGESLDLPTSWGVDSLTPEETCATLPLSSGQDAYTVMRLDTHRKNPQDGENLPPVFVHVARAPEGEGLRIVGVERELL